MTVAVEMYRSVPRYLAARAAGSRAKGILAGPVAPLRLVDGPGPTLPAAGWARVRPRLAGICGSDLNTIAGTASFYFSALVSMPFVPGHEVVGTLLDACGDLPAGERVILSPVLACAARGIDPPCGPCAAGDTALCERVTAGHVRPGLQTGYCASTGGGWSGMLVAHRSQLHPVPDGLSDEAAVMVEPAACAVHAVRRARVPRDGTVLVVGAGTVGLLTIAALRAHAEAGRLISVAKHGRQAELALAFGASHVVSTSDALGAVRRATRAFRCAPERSPAFLLGGADVSFECAGSRAALDLALRATRARGRVVLAGMPAGADLSPAWFRELEVVGAYTGGAAFGDAVRLAEDAALGKLVSAAYPLAGWRQALDHAFSAGSLGSVKVVFDPRLDS